MPGKSSNSSGPKQTGTKGGKRVFDYNQQDRATRRKMEQERVAGAAKPKASAAKPAPPKPAARAAKPKDNYSSLTTNPPKNVSELQSRKAAIDAKTNPPKPPARSTYMSPGTSEIIKNQKAVLQGTNVAPKGGFPNPPKAKAKPPARSTYVSPGTQEQITNWKATLGKKGK